MSKPIRVQVMEREYALRVKQENEAMMRQVADEVSARMNAFQKAHPQQARLTTAVVTALALAEELRTLRQQVEASERETAGALHVLSDELAGLLGEAAAAASAHEDAVNA